MEAFNKLQRRIVVAARRHRKLFFVTIYFDPKWMKDYSDLPLFADQSKLNEKQFRSLISKVFKSLREKAQRQGFEFNYVIVLALSKVKHKLHKVLHSHALVTWLPDLSSHPDSKRKERLKSSWLDKKLKGLHLVAWVETPRNTDAVARYTAQNAKTVIGKKQYAGMRIYPMSQGWEK